MTEADALERGRVRIRRPLRQRPRPSGLVFPDELRTRALRRRELEKRGVRQQHYELLGPFRYRSAELGEILVPAGFVTDYGSVPGWATWYISGEDPALIHTSVVHDYLYQCRGVLPGGRRYTRRVADQVLASGMREQGARRDQIAIVFAAVRLGGGLHW